MADDQKQDANVKVGGAYVENPDFVPNPTDMYGTFNTSGTGAHHDPATVSPIFEVDRNLTAQEIVNALDPEHPTPRDRVVFAEPKPVVSADNEAEEKSLREKAEARLEQEVVIGGPTPAEQEAAEGGEESSRKAEQQERDNSVASPVTGASSTSGGSASTSTASTKDEEKDGELKGEALDKALEERGLPKTGTADEKRKAVADHDKKAAK